MFSIIRWIINLFRAEPDEITIRRLPRLHVLRANLVGLALGLLVVYLALIWEAVPLPWISVLLLFLYFSIGTYLGGISVVLSLFLFIVSLRLGSVDGPPTTTLALLKLSRWHVLGYLFGALFALTYNDFLFVVVNLFKEKYLKTVFHYKKQVCNVIKAPDITEVTRLVGADEMPLYDYQPRHISSHPYTIVFVANPRVLKKFDYNIPDTTSMEFQNALDIRRADAVNYDPDPMMQDLPLFLRTVDRALHSLERDDVIGRPEIWSQVRIVTIFDADIAGGRGMLEEFQRGLFLDDGSEVDNMISPIDSEIQSAVQAALSEDSGCISYDKVDVIYVLSAHVTHDRCSAHFSDYYENRLLSDIPAYDPTKGQVYYMDVDPAVPHAIQKDDQINVHRPTHTLPSALDCCSAYFLSIHEHRSEIPGTIALNALSNRSKTYVHEFAHAMSSLFTGMIVDEYFDRLRLGEAVESEEDESKCFDEGVEKDCLDAPDIAPYYLNKIVRNWHLPPPAVIPVHRIFCEYNGEIFCSDRDHPSAEENWLGYFPNRAAKERGCIMDRTIGGYQFDPLISTFMYDRLMAKINRP